jgi:hypothetical protein
VAKKLIGRGSTWENTMNQSTRRFGSNGLNGLLSLAIIGLIVLGCTCGDSLDLSNLGETGNASNDPTPPPFGDKSGSMPDDTLIRALVKETMADFAYAVSTNDFTKIHDKASTDFQRTVTVERMQREFKIFVDRKTRYLPSLSKIASTEVDFSEEPSLRTEQGLDILITKGKYPTKPMAVNFDLEYVKRDGRWKLLKLIVKM